MSILVIVQSWEDELRGKDISPCRLLFLDEAARLDARSIATLFELCERLEMQLIIAAPENISPEKGTTYKLVRKVFNNHEHVHVVGCAGLPRRCQKRCRERPTPPEAAATFWRLSGEEGNVKLPFFYPARYARVV